MDSIEPHHRYGKRFSLISIAAAIALVLGASVKAQETTDIKLDLNTYTLYDAANRADVVRVTGDKPEGFAVLFHNVLVAPKVCPWRDLSAQGGRRFELHEWRFAGHPVRARDREGAG